MNNQKSSQILHQKSDYHKLVQEGINSHFLPSPNPIKTEEISLSQNPRTCVCICVQHIFQLYILKILIQVKQSTDFNP